MIRSIYANLIQLTSRNYILAGLGASFILAFVTVMLNVSEVEAAVEERGPLGESLTLAQLSSSSGLALLLGSTITMVGLVVMAINASAVASDYSTGMIRNLSVRQPNRIKLQAGKTIALALATIVVTFLVLATTISVSLLFRAEEIDTSQWLSTDGGKELLQASFNFYIAALGWGILGQVVALITRSSVAALATGVMIAIPLDLVLTDAVESSRPWLPGQLLQAVARGGTRHLEYETSLATVILAMFISLAAAITVFYQRDITS